MPETDLLEPERLYTSQLKQKNNDKVEEYFNKITKESAVDIGANHETVRRYNEEMVKADKINKSLGKSKFLLVLFIILIVVGFILLVIGIGDLVASNTLGVLFLIIGLIACVGGILLIIFVYKKRKNKLSAELAEITAKANKLKAEAYEQMAKLNSLIDVNVFPCLFTETTPLIEMDKIFDNKKFELLVSKYGYTGYDDDNHSILGIQSGSILGNPFAIFKEKNMNIVNRVYKGTRVISWVTYEGSGSSRHPVTHTQTLVATIEKPAPEYGDDTYIIYGNEAAPNLTFTRRLSNINSMNDKEIAKYVSKHEKDLEKMAIKEMKHGGNYTPLGNAEFELFFGGLDRNNEVEYRLLFTPLGQKSMLQVLKSKVGYGDDFNMKKDHMINMICSKHSQAIDLFANKNYFIDYDYEACKNRFISYGAEYFKSIFFDLAPVLSIPLYQQHKAHEYIYKENYKSNLPSIDHEIMANSFNPKSFVHPDSKTEAIMKTLFVGKNKNVDNVKVTAHTFNSIQHIDDVMVMGGDGSLHAVPVTWYEYIPLTQESEIFVSDASLDIGANSGVITNRGLSSYRKAD